jgi:hypothetical protein
MAEKRLQMGVQHVEHFMQAARIVVGRLVRVWPKQTYCMDEKQLQTGERRLEHFMQGAHIVVARLGRVQSKWTY